MNTQQAYILISLVILFILSIIVFFVKKNKNNKKFTKLDWFAFVFVFAGIIFGEKRLIGYSLMGIGVVIAIIDIIKKLKSK